MTTSKGFKNVVKLRDIISAKDYEAKIDGATDDKAAIQSALDTGKLVWLPAGTALVSAALTLANYGGLIGSGHELSKIKYTGPDICLDAYACTSTQIRDLALLTDQGAGTTAIRIYGNTNRVSDVMIKEYSNQNSAWGTGVEVRGSTDLVNPSFITHLENVSILHYKTYGIKLHRSIDTHITGCSIFGVTDQTTGIGLYVETGVSGLYVRGLSIAYGQNGMQVNDSISAGVGTYGNAPIYMFFDQMLCDTTTGGHAIWLHGNLGASIVNSFFTNCWAAAAGRTAAGAISTAGSNGVLIEGGDGWNFTACRIRLNARNGVIVNTANCHRVALNSCYVTSNNLDNNADGHGVYIAQAVTGFTMVGCVVGNVLDTTGHQKYGIKIGALNVNNYRIVGNDLASNDTGPINNASTGSGETWGNAPADGTTPNHTYNSIALGPVGRIFSENQVVAGGGTLNLRHHLQGGMVIIRDATHGGTGIYRTDEAAATNVISGAAQFVAGAAGANQIGLTTAAGGPTQISNGYAGNVNICVTYIAAQG